MPASATKTVGHINQQDGHGHTRHLTNQAESVKVPGFRFDGSGKSFQTASVAEHAKAKPGGRFNDSNDPDRMAMKSIRSPARKATSAKIAKIPFTLSEWVGRTYMPL